MSYFKKKYLFFLSFWLVIIVLNILKMKIGKTQKKDLIISLKLKKTILEMALKSFIISKLDQKVENGSPHTL